MTSSGWTRQHRCEYRQTTVQEPWGATPSSRRAARPRCRLRLAGGGHRRHHTRRSAPAPHPRSYRGIRACPDRRTGPGGTSSGQSQRDAARTTSCAEASSGDPGPAHSASGGSSVECLKVHGGQVDQQRKDPGGTNPAEVALTFAPVLFITRHTIRGRDNQMISVPRLDTVLH